MKKPEKKEVPECLNDISVGDYESAYNEGRKEMEAYYEQEIKENYIRKDSLSVEKILKVLNKAGLGKSSIDDIETTQQLAEALIKSIKGE